MEEIDQNIDPELEVKKLQDLVKKLEKQNEQLRNARRSGQSITDSPTKQRKMTPTQQKNREQEINKKLANMSLDEVDLIKIMSDDEEDEEKEDSWLYVSPARSATPTHKNTSPYKWVREDFEKSSPEVDSTRQSLLLKLDECSRGYVYSPNVSRDSNEIASLSPIEETRTPSPTIPQIKQQLRDIRTITASKWSSASSPSRSGTLTPSTPLDEAFLRRKESDDADDEDEDSYKLQDMTDVQVMARIQEETLRKSQTSTPTTQTPPGRENSPRNKSSNSKENVPPHQGHGRETNMDKILKSARAILEFGHQVEMRGGSAPDVLESNFLANETFPILEELQSHKKDKFKPYAEGAKPVGVEHFKPKPIVSSKVAAPKSSTEPKMGLNAAITEEKSRLENNAGTAYLDSVDKVSKQMIERNAQMEKEMEELSKMETGEFIDKQAPNFKHDLVRKRLFEDDNLEWGVNEKAEEVEKAQRRAQEHEDMSELSLEVARATEMIENMLKAEGKYKEANSYENSKKINEKVQADRKEKGSSLEEVIGQEVMGQDCRQHTEAKKAEMQEDSATHQVAEKVVRAFQDGDQEPNVSEVTPQARNNVVEVPIHTQEAKLGHAHENGHQDIAETSKQAPIPRNKFFSGDHVPTPEEFANLDDSVQAVPERFLARSPREDDNAPLPQDKKSVHQDDDIAPQDTSKLPGSYLKLKQLLDEGVELDETDPSLIAVAKESSEGGTKLEHKTSGSLKMNTTISDKPTSAQKLPASKAVQSQLKKTGLGASQRSLPSPSTQASTEQQARRVDSPQEYAGSSDGSSLGFSRDDRSYHSLPRMSTPRRKGSGSTDKPLLTQNLLQKRFLESNGYDGSQQEETTKFQALPKHSHLAKWLSTQNTPKHLPGSLDRAKMKAARSSKPEDARSSKSDMYPMTAKRRSGLKPPRSFGLSLHYPMAHALKSSDPEGCRSPASDIPRGTPRERRTSEPEGYKTPSSDNSGSLLHVDDVKLVARLQEESLRQELSPRRLSSPRQRPDTLQYDDGDPFPEDEYESPRNLYYSPRDSRSSSRSQSPQRHLGDSPRNQSPKVQRKQYYTNDDSRSGSSNLSGSNSSLHSTPVNGEGREKQPLRRSMPNLSKSTITTTNQQSSPIRNSQNQESKMRTPTSTGNPAASQSGLRQPQLRQSGSGIPRGTGIPTRQSPQAKSGIPRPGQRRGIPVPKSGIPTPGSGIPRAGVRGMRGDDNWREGCY